MRNPLNPSKVIRIPRGYLGQTTKPMIIITWKKEDPSQPALDGPILLKKTLYGPMGWADVRRDDACLPGRVLLGRLVSRTTSPGLSILRNEAKHKNRLRPNVGTRPCAWGNDAASEVAPRRVNCWLKTISKTPLWENFWKGYPPGFFVSEVRTGVSV